MPKFKYNSSLSRRQCLEGLYPIRHLNSSVFIRFLFSTYKTFISVYENLCPLDIFSCVLKALLPAGL
jgi:hypothetical protein